MMYFQKSEAVAVPALARWYCVRGFIWIVALVKYVVTVLLLAMDLVGCGYLDFLYCICLLGMSLSLVGRPLDVDLLCLKWPFVLLGFHLSALERIYQSSAYGGSNVEEELLNVVACMSGDCCADLEEQIVSESIKQIVVALPVARVSDESVAEGAAGFVAEAIWLLYAADFVIQGLLPWCLLEFAANALVIYTWVCVLLRGAYGAWAVGGVEAASSFLWWTIQTRLLLLCDIELKHSSANYETATDWQFNGCLQMKFC
ncbi:hypothetical protein Nepgr_031344 [Nepenthes gracilis]|uniref:Uncharacterized protein n=1 Tax=Nepenthes gracilis TaxID=150966 RepID=A0AAD3THX7_NEPGR|nr:hypothetical protein Nepgr_031344 [Nepenthes gracilis]